MKVFSTLAIQGAVEALLPHFEQATGLNPAIEWNTAPVLVKRLQAGETADVLILNRAGMDTMQREGRILAGTEATLASSPTALAIKAGAARPDISSEEALKRTLRAARALSYSDPAAGGASGIYFGKLLERWGMVEEINAKTKFPPPAGYCAEFLVTGEVDLALQQAPELLHVPGVEILGPLPGDLHMVTVFVAGIDAASTNGPGGKMFIDFLRSAVARTAFRRRGLDPATS